MFVVRVKALEKTHDDLIYELAHYRDLLVRATNETIIEKLKELILEIENKLGGSP
jgi:hypothetical protein